jgi:hypothetical protein
MFPNSYTANAGEGGGEVDLYKFQDLGNPGVRKGARNPTMMRMFLFFSVVSLPVNCTN